MSEIIVINTHDLPVHGDTYNYENVLNVARL